MATMREAGINSRRAVEEVVIIGETVTDRRKAIAEAVALGLALGSIDVGRKTWNTNARCLR